MPLTASSWPAGGSAAYQWLPGAAEDAHADWHTGYSQEKTGSCQVSLGEADACWAQLAMSATLLSPHQFDCLWISRLHVPLT